MPYLRKRASRFIFAAVLVGIVGGLILFAVHQHTSGDQDTVCTLCHYAAGLILPLVAAVITAIALLTRGTVYATIHKHVRTLPATPCGLRAPPLPL